MFLDVLLPVIQSDFSGKDFYSSEMFPKTMSSYSTVLVMQPTFPSKQVDVRAMIEEYMEKFEQQIALRLNIFESRITALEQSRKSGDSFK